MNTIRKKAVAAKCGVSPMTIHRWTRDDTYSHLEFPKPFELDRGILVWDESEVDAWLLERAAAGRRTAA